MRAKSLHENLAAREGVERFQFRVRCPRQAAFSCVALGRHERLVCRAERRSLDYNDAVN